MRIVFRAAFMIALVSLLCIAPAAIGWAANAERLITTKAVDILPDEIRTYFEGNRQFLIQHVLDPVGAAQKNS